MLVVTSPVSSHSHILRSIALYSSWASRGQQKPIPVLVDLSSVKSPAETCIEEALSQHGLDAPTIQQARRERLTFLFLVSGFETCGVPTNIYMRNKMYEWPGAKAIFTISPECKNISPCLKYYFIPCSERSLQALDEDAFQIIEAPKVDLALSSSNISISLWFIMLIYIKFLYKI